MQYTVQPKILSNDDTITIEIPKRALAKLLMRKKDDTVKHGRTDWKKIRSLRGAWKHMDIDPLEYQINIRSEWDR